MLARFALCRLSFLAFAYRGGPCGNRNPGFGFDGDRRRPTREPVPFEHLIERGVVHPEGFGPDPLIELAARQPGVELNGPVLHVRQNRQIANRCQAENAIIFGLLPTGPMLLLQTAVNSQLTPKALTVLGRNIETLLAARKEEQKTLSEWCGHDKSWMNKFLNEGRGIRIVDLDKIASFFGIEPYQLFQPGISSLTERRIMGDRRSGQERRIGHQGRELASLRTELNKHPAVASSSHGVPLAPRPSPPNPAIERILKRAAAELFAVQSGQQAPAPRLPRPVVPRRDRKARGSDSGKG